VRQGIDQTTKCQKASTFTVKAIARHL